MRKLSVGYFPFRELTPTSSVDDILPQKTTSTSTSATSSVDDFLRKFESKVIHPYENIVREELNKIGIENETDSPKKTKVYLRYSALIMLKADFDRVYLSIFGSQMDILYHLNSKREGEDIKILKSFYDNAVKTYPGVYINYSFEQYMYFLSSRNLITEQKENNIIITEYGHEFLNYIVAAGLSERHLY